MSRFALRFFFAVLMVVLVTSVSWATIDFRYTVSDYGAGCKNAETEGGHTFELCYAITPGTYKFIETNAWYTVHPDSPPEASSPGDFGFFKRGPVCATSWQENNLEDSFFTYVSPGDQLIMASGWAVDGGGNVLTRNDLNTVAGDFGSHIVISSALMTADGRLEVINGPVTLADTEINSPFCCVYLKTVNPDCPAWPQAFTHIEFDPPVPIANPATNNLGASVIYGFHFYRSDLDPLVSTPADFSKATAEPVLADGTVGPPAICNGYTGGPQNVFGTWGGSGLLYFNDSNLPFNTDTIHYIISLVLFGGNSWSSGVEFLFEGTAGWYPIGYKTGGYCLEGANSRFPQHNRKKISLNWRSLSPFGVPPALLRKKLTLPEPVWAEIEEIAV